MPGGRIYSFKCSMLRDDYVENSKPPVTSEKSGYRSLAALLSVLALFQRSTHRLSRFNLPIWPQCTP
jgi:hypothetical protein